MVSASEHGVAHQVLQRRAADLGIDAAVAVEQPYLQLVGDLDDAAGPARVGDRRALLPEGAHRATQRDEAIV
jgi:hypothetical protein